MKLISLNVWGGRVEEELIDFLRRYKKETDIFCLQEVYHEAEGKELVYLDAHFDIYRSMQRELEGYAGYYRPHLRDYYGLAAFVKNKTALLEEGETYVHKHRGYIPTGHVGFHAKNIQYLKFALAGREITIVNFHGLWNGQGKTDTAERLAQSENIKKFLNTLHGEKIVCGDFNLLPDTESLKMLEDGGLRNLIKINNITSTRTSFYPKEHRFADYVLVSEGVKVKHFEVLPDEVSDHAPLYLEFE